MKDSPEGPHKKRREMSPERNTAEKGPSSWTFAMSAEGGKLASYTNEVLGEMENKEGADWNAAFEKVQRASNNFQVISGTREPPVASWKNVENSFPALKCFPKQFQPASLDGPNVFSLITYLPHDLQRFLLGSGAIAVKVLFDIQARMEGSLPEVGKYKGFKKPADSLDLGSPAQVMQDNLQTTLDVSSLLARFVETPRELSVLFHRILEKCPNDEVVVKDRTFQLNPHDYSYFELFALAPFSFWVAVREAQPETCEGKPIVRPEDFERPIDPKFLYIVTREQPLIVTPRHKRHGGCPALYPEFRHFDLFNRLGKVFLRAQEEFLAHEETKEGV